MLNQSQKTEFEQKRQLKPSIGRPKKYLEYVTAATISFFLLIKKPLHVSQDVVFIGLVQLMTSNIVNSRNGLDVINYEIFYFLFTVLTYNAISRINLLLEMI